MSTKEKHLKRRKSLKPPNSGREKEEEGVRDMKGTEKEGGGLERERQREGGEGRKREGGRGEKERERERKRERERGLSNLDF